MLVNDPMLGVLRYEESYNLGDEVQSLAASEILGIGNVGVFLDRNTGDVVALDRELGEDEKVNVIANGWYHHRYSKFPFPENVNPLFISFHVNTDDHKEDKRYAYLQDHTIIQPTIEANTEYLKKYEPIGCRDYHTVNLLKDRGIDAYFSGCLTLTLKNPFFNYERTEEILVIDAHISVPDLFTEVVPQHVREKAVYISQALSVHKSREEKFALARAHMNRLARAKLVITTRLHSALPCLAYGTPVVLLCDNLEDSRLKTYLPFVKHYGVGDKAEEGFDFLSYRNPSNDDLFAVAESSKEKVQEWIERVKNNYKKSKNMTLSYLPEQEKRGYSFVTACMNRSSFLSQVVQSWVDARPDEIIIVDWNNSAFPSVRKIVEDVRVKNPRFKDKIKTVTVRNVSSWSLTRSFNLAVSAASYDKVLKLDCDTMLDPSFLLYHNLDKENVFFCGDWTKARDENERHINGVVYMKKKDFLSVHGYNEYIQGYGWDDSCLYNRLEKISKRYALNQDLLSHVEHSNVTRIENMETDDKEISLRLDIQIEKNRLVSEGEKWAGPMSEYEVVSDWVDGNIDVTLDKYVTFSQEKSEIYLEKAKRNRSYVDKSKRKRMFVQVVNGLGNRLRCLASAYVIALATNRDLTVIWIPDSHCNAKFQDLFEKNFITEIFQVINREDKVEDILRKYTVIDETHHSGTATFRDVFPLELGKHVKPFIDYYNYSVYPNEYIDDKTSDDIFIVSACVLNNRNTNWYKEAVVLRYLVPIKEVSVRVFQTEIENNAFANVIGVHIRMGQDPAVHKYEDVSNYSSSSKYSVQKWRSAADWTFFAKKMESILSEDPKQIFYIACDRQETYDNLTNMFKNKIIYTKRTDYDRSLKQNVFALIDMYLLSKCKYILGSNWSSYSEVAHKISGKKMYIAGIDF